jgi:predicted Zn-dependent peptidase
LSQYRKTILPNGIRVLTESISYVKSFSLGFWFDVGSRDEDFGNNGITHVIEHMVFKGTKTRTARKIANDIEAYGGYLNAFTSKEHTCYYGRGMSNHLEKTFDVISDMIQNPLFKPSDLKKEASVIIDELYDIEDNPEELIFDKFEEIIFSGNSLSLPIIGTEKNIKGLTQEDLFGFINNKYGFDRLIVAASGAVEHEELIRLTEKYIVKKLPHAPINRVYFEKETLPAKVEFIDKEIQQVHVILGNATYGYKDKGRIEAAVLTQLLGEGSSSRMFQALRERNGIAYQINSFLNSFYDISSFGIYFSTNEKMLDKALTIVKREFKKIRETKVGSKEIKRAKEALKGNMLLSLESTSNRMIRMAQSELYYNRIKHTEEVIKSIDGVTADSMLELSNELLDYNTLVQIIIKSKNAIIKSAA